MQARGAVDRAGQYWPGLQAVTLKTVGSGQKLPAGQPTQLMLAVRLHWLKAYWPDAHAPQGVQTAALGVDEYDVPSWQLAHVMFCWLVQAEATDDPAAHMEQTLGAVEPAGQKLLAGHKICTEALGQ